ncbi:MAG: YitT family protein [candidate division Zixibacteria bacterium]|nr:YitT family protein [candidate division Zixibacteria bacterium]
MPVVVKKKKYVHDEKLFSRKWFLNYSLLIIGSIIVAVGYVFFLVPYNIVPGGIFGLSMVISSLSGLPIGILAMVLNIPLLAWGIRSFNTSFSVKSLVGVIVSSISVDVLMYFYKDVRISDDILVSSIFGGVIIGGALAVVIKANATTGGTDLMARIITKYTKIPVGKNLLIIDSLIILFSIIVFRDINLAPYALIAIFSISKTIDAVLTGLDDKKAVFIISDKHEEIRLVILEKMDRGGTYLMASGLYHKDSEKKMIFSALSRREMAKLQSYIKRIDPEAFIMVVNTHEIIGSGFKPFE